MYAIIEDSGTQIKVSKGDVLDIDLRTDTPEKGSKKAQTLSFDRVLMIGDAGSDKAANIGTPYISGASVTAEIIEETRGDKIDVIMYKKRKGQRRKIGHRQPYLRVKITGING